jgi:hypothetical protein
MWTYKDFNWESFSSKEQLSILEKYYPIGKTFYTLFNGGHLGDNCFQVIGYVNTPLKHFENELIKFTDFYLVIISRLDSDIIEHRIPNSLIPTQETIREMKLDLILN